MFGAGGRIIEPACNGIYRRGIAVFVFQHNAVESVHYAFFAVRQACRVVADVFASAHRFDADKPYGIVQKRVEHTDTVTAAADAGAYYVGKFAGHCDKLFPCLLTYDKLEIPDHHGKRMRSKRAADAINRVVVFAKIRFKRRVNRFFQRFQPFRNRYHVCAQNFHTGNVRRLLFHVDFAHINVAFQPEIRRSRRKSDAVLSRARFGNEFFLSHKRRKQPFAHTVVELMRARMVQIFAF